MSSFVFKENCVHNNLLLKFIFSNSLIIHQEKTKKITTVTEVWILDPNYHKILPTLAFNFSKNYCSFEKPYESINTRKCVSSDIQTPRSRLKKTRLRLVFSTYFSVFGYPMKHSNFLVFDILLNAIKKGESLQTCTYVFLCRWLSSQVMSKWMPTTGAGQKMPSVRSRS